MKYSDWYRAERKAQKAYAAACKRGNARADSNVDPVTVRLCACARACDKAYLQWLAAKEQLSEVTIWDDFVR
jgi:hypothetical protein